MLGECWALLGPQENKKDFYRNQKDVGFVKSTTGTGPQYNLTRNKHGMVTRLYIVQLVAVDWHLACKILILCIATDVGIYGLLVSYRVLTWVYNIVSGWLKSSFRILSTDLNSNRT